MVAGIWASVMSSFVDQLVALNVHVAVGKRKDKTRPCEKCRHLERGTHVPDGRIPQREEVEMVRPCTKER